MIQKELLSVAPCKKINCQNTLWKVYNDKIVCKCGNKRSRMPIDYKNISCNINISNPQLAFLANK